jgi:hypothetical protein
MKVTAGPHPKPASEIRNQSAAASSNAQRWRIFAIHWAVFSPLSSKPLKANVVSMEKIVPDFLAQEMLS